MSEIPTLAEELERKTLSEIERLNRNFDQGVINAAQFSMGLETIFQVVAGLVPEPIILAIESMDHLKSDPSCDTKRTFLNPLSGIVISVRRHDQGRKIAIVRFVSKNRVPTISESSFESTVTSKLRHEQTCQKILDSGFLEV